jgi:hypothetical protein
MTDAQAIGFAIFIPIGVVVLWVWITRKRPRHERGEYRHMATVSHVRNGFKSRQGIH